MLQEPRLSPAGLQSGRLRRSATIAGPIPGRACGAHLSGTDSWEARKHIPVSSASGNGRAEGDTAHTIKGEDVSFFSVGQRDV